jgi:hypothetical protein
VGQSCKKSPEPVETRPASRVSSQFEHSPHELEVLRGRRDSPCHVCDCLFTMGPQYEYNHSRSREMRIRPKELLIGMLWATTRTMTRVVLRTLRHKFALVILFASASVFAQTAVPFLNQPLVPSAVTAGSSGFTLTVNGTGFVPGAAVQWNGMPLVTNFVSASQLTTNVPSSKVAVSGTISVTAVNPGTPSSNAALFSVTSPTTDFFYTHAQGSPIPLGMTGGFLNAPLAMATADFNGDGISDLAVALEAGAANPGFLQIFLGNGDGTFSGVAATSPLGMGPGSIAVGDLNGDGRVDLAVSNFGTSSILGDFPGTTVDVLLGIGDGTFIVASGSPVTVGTAPTAAVIADFNGDGKLDLAVANSTDQTVSILSGNGNGSFATSSSIAATDAFALAAGDFNQDGNLDLAVSNSASSSVTILLGNGDGTFTPAASPVATSGYAIAAADFNGDAKLDLAVGYRAGLPVAILLGNGDGTFNAVSGCCGTFIEQTITNSMVVGDLNGDGKLDLDLSFESQLGSIAGFELVMLGNGDGTFASTDFSMLLAPRVGTPVLSDFNGDGRMDLADSGSAFAYLSILLQSPPPINHPDFAVNALDTTASVAPGDAADFQIQLSSLNGFLGVVSLTCSGAPSSVQCSLPPPLFLFDTATATFHVTLSTAAPNVLATKGDASAPRSGPSTLKLVTGILGITFAICLIPPFDRFSHRAARVSSAFLVVSAMCILFGSCGGGSATTPPPVTSGTPPGTYKITVNASSGQLQHSTTITLVVK